MRKLQAAAGGKEDPKPAINRIPKVRIISWLLHDGGRVRQRSSSGLLRYGRSYGFADHGKADCGDAVIRGSSQFRQGA